MRGSLGRVLVLLVTLGVLLAIAAALPGPRSPAAVQVGPIHRVVTEPYVFEPDIAVDPTNPDRLAASVAAADALTCDSLHGGCTVILLLATSEDGGSTWQEQRLTTGVSIDGTVAFAPDGTLDEAGIVYTPIPTAFFHREIPETLAGATAPHLFPARADKPWISIDRRTGAIFVDYSILPGLALERSIDAGKTWTRSVMPVGYGGQVLPGAGTHLTVAFEGPPTGGAATAYQQQGVNVVTSADGGMTFSPPATLGLGWGLEGTASGAGADYVAYLAGPQQAERVTVAASKDGGTTWRSSVASGATSLFYAPVAPPPALGVAPDGTVDLLYYAATGRCTDPAAFQREYPTQPLGHWLDPCSYNLDYTFSKDGGEHWAPPYQLNGQPLAGKGFVQIPAGRTRSGDYMGMASTDQYAYPLWVAPTDSKGTEADVVRIRR